MSAAICLAELRVGLTCKNPSVGALIVRGDDVRSFVVGHAATAIGGRPHAEIQALQMAGSFSCGATAYVTLEPCAHYGETPPCVDALIHSGISRVVIAFTDPDKRVCGRGISILKAAGVKVVEGVLRDEAFETLSAYFCVKNLQRCEVTLKMAISADNGVGKKGNGGIRISGVASRKYVHILRARSDAIMVGIGTILADDPQLSCRLPGLEMRSPVRIILDKNLRIPLNAKVVQTAMQIPTWIICDETLLDGRKKVELERYGVRVYSVKVNNNLMHPLAILQLLCELGINSVLLEGGTKTGEIFLNVGCVDHLICFYTPIILGKDRIRPPHIESYLSEFSKIETRMLENDHLCRWRRKALCLQGL
ncbi:Diaminohydroxyphosphoribosylaminopyrimidine deaminase [Bartonella ancashensis]|uniref:Riboflavin biosynthesis protein RibD n=2 Tax=Bartonella ancashensis TaxID=1318743 RepID=A0A0M4M6L6_9HYPH|nr:Diaminohydroxyphosphoribosylaminopyrimidine deaminase [Bartonella ancashensis]